MDQVEMIVQDDLGRSEARRQHAKAFGVSTRHRWMPADEELTAKQAFVRRGNWEKALLELDVAPMDLPSKKGGRL